MTDQQGKAKNSLSEAFAHLGATMASTPLPYLLGVGIMIAAGHWDGHLHTQPSCFDVKEIGGQLIKLNTCTGDTQVIGEAGKVAASPPQPTSK